MDAIDQFVKLFNTEEDFINTFVESTLFFPENIVKKRNEELLSLNQNEGRFPVRYSPSVKEFWNVNNKKEAIKHTREKVVSLEGYPSLNVLIDHDGNTEVRKLIKSHFGHKVSIGKNSTIKNFTISHVWGMATHPLFFTSLWNIVLIPTHFNYLMDKEDEAHPIVKKVKTAIKQKCIQLYSPYESFLKHFEVEASIKNEFKLKPSDKNNFQFNFVSHIDSREEEAIITVAENDKLDRLLKSIGKAFFVDYFDVYMNEEDPAKNIPVGEYTYKSYQSRVSNMKRIFKDNLEVQALRIALNSRLDTETKSKAHDLLELYR